MILVIRSLTRYTGREELLQLRVDSRNEAGRSKVRMGENRLPKGLQKGSHKLVEEGLAFATVVIIVIEREEDSGKGRHESKRRWLQ